MIQTYYGNGKGKTSAAIGAAVRAAGSGMKVLFVQLLKDGSSSEICVLKNVKNIDCINSCKDYKLFEDLSEKRVEDIKTNACEFFNNTLLKIYKNYSMIVFDECLDALKLCFIKSEPFLNFLKEQKQNIEFIITGHEISQDIAEISDYISYIKLEKHPYYNGAKSRKGIEF